MSAKADQFIDELTAHGDISFTLGQMMTTLGISQSAARSAVKRLKKQHKIASPAKGYYLILPPEFRGRGCLPPDFFIDDLMQHLGLAYYVCLLSAAMFYGAAHQQPQMMQVMLEKTRKPIQCGQITIEFIQHQSLDITACRRMKTRTGYLSISTPEATARDMLSYVRRCGGIQRILTVIEELVESMDVAALRTLAQQATSALWIHRLGFLLESVGASHLSSVLYEHIDQTSDFIPLVPYGSMTKAPRNRKWRIAINTPLQSDLNDT